MQKELLKWNEFNTCVNKAINTHTTYDCNNYGRYEERKTGELKTLFTM